MRKVTDLHIRIAPNSVLKATIFHLAEEVEEKYPHMLDETAVTAERPSAGTRRRPQERRGPLNPPVALRHRDGGRPAGPPQRHPHPHAEHGAGRHEEAGRAHLRAGEHAEVRGCAAPIPCRPRGQV